MDSTNPERKQGALWYLVILTLHYNIVTSIGNMFKQLVKMGNSYGTFFISVLLVIIYLMSFGLDSFRRYHAQEIVINKEIKTKKFIPPPGKFN